jgi:hypothetical protein
VIWVQFQRAIFLSKMLHLAASLADRVPVSLGEAVTGIDDRNVGLLVMAIRHASGRRQFPLVRRA